jgi:hypothetical protein
VQESNTSNVQDLKNMLKACLSKWELYWTSQQCLLNLNNG